uniref:Uncharacterized protein n=1 Tax=Anguilla anguilla TaxID=7936 RepID=A0A0E9PKS3_ANGAN
MRRIQIKHCRTASSLGLRV